MPQPEQVVLCCLVDEMKQSLENESVDSIRERFAADPAASRRFVAVEREWGEEQWMPLHVAAAAGRAGVVALLLELGVKPDSQTRYVSPLHGRQTALHLAAPGTSPGQGAVLTQLLDARATVEVRDALGRSPLWIAARHLFDAGVELLLQHHANPNAVDQQHRPPLHAALLSDPSDAPPTDMATRLGVVDRLLDGGADPNATCPREADGFTALHRCVSLGDGVEPIIARLLHGGADATLTDPRHGLTAAELALQRGQRGLRDALIRG